MGLRRIAEKYQDSYKIIQQYQEEIEQKNRRVKRLELQLTTNPLTGLPNSLVLHKEFEDFLIATSSDKIAIFLTFNDSFNLLRRIFSTKIPEWILYQTSLRLQKLIGDEGKIYHTQNEEFLLLIHRKQDVKDIPEFATKMIEIVEKPYVMAGYTIALHVNLGIALYPEHGRQKSTLLRHADMALSEAINNKTRFEIFTPALKETIVERAELQHSILFALESQANTEAEQQFELFFQPQIQLENWNTPLVKGQVIGAETLLRWNHPKLGYIPPAKFIPIAEDSGLIIPLGHWILHMAVTYLLDLKRRGFHQQAISVNFSSLQFNYEDIAMMTQEIVHRRGLSPKNLKLEITESGLMCNFSRTMKRIQNLREKGFQILVDDFGTGYSSLSYLKNLPVDVVKIDKAFVDKITHNLSDQALTKAIITLAKELNLGIIVEGAETREQIDWLTQHGCCVFQGYYFSEPLSYKNFIQFIKDFPRIFAEKVRSSSSRFSSTSK